MKSAPEKVTAAEAALAAPDAVQLVAAPSPPQDFDLPAQQPRRPCCSTVALAQHPGGDILVKLLNSDDHRGVVVVTKTLKDGSVTVVCRACDPGRNHRFRSPRDAVYSLQRDHFQKRHGG